MAPLVVSRMANRNGWSARNVTTGGGAAPSLNTVAVAAAASAPSSLTSTHAWWKTADMISESSWGGVWPLIPEKSACKGSNGRVLVVEPVTKPSRETRHRLSHNGIARAWVRPIYLPEAIWGNEFDVRRVKCAHPRSVSRKLEMRREWGFGHRAVKVHRAAAARSGARLRLDIVTHADSADGSWTATGLYFPPWLSPGIRTRKGSRSDIDTSEPGSSRI